jgi:hypothetical protein
MTQHDKEGLQSGPIRVEWADTEREETSS